MWNVVYGLWFVVNSIRDFPVNCKCLFTGLIKSVLNKITKEKINS
jgi:hypothetical protein